MYLIDRLANLPGIQELPSFGTLLSEINADMGNGDIWFVLFLAFLMLTFHVIAV